MSSLRYAVSSDSHCTRDGSKEPRPNRTKKQEQRKWAGSNTTSRARPNHLPLVVACVTWRDLIRWSSNATILDFHGFSKLTQLANLCARRDRTLKSDYSLTMKQSHCCHFFGLKRDKVALLDSRSPVCGTLTCDLILSPACLLVFTLLFSVLISPD